MAGGAWRRLLLVAAGLSVAAATVARSRRAVFRLPADKKLLRCRGGTASDSGYPPQQWGAPGGAAPGAPGPGAGPQQGAPGQAASPQAGAYGDTAGPGGYGTPAPGGPGGGAAHGAYGGEGYGARLRKRGERCVRGERREEERREV